MYRLTIRIRSDDTIFCPNTNTLFGPLFGTEANDTGVGYIVYDIGYIPNFIVGIYYS